MRIVRELPDQESAELLALTEELVARELAPAASAGEAAAEFPRELVRLLGKSGLLGLPYPESVGGAGVPFDVYLQVLEELSRGWLSVGLGVSVHTLSCFPVATAGSADQQASLLPAMLGGELLGAYCLSEPQCGSDAAALTTVARRDSAGYLIDGVKAWITHAGQADYYVVMARTGEPGPKGISCFLVPADSAGLSVGAPERKMGMRSSPTAQVILNGVRVTSDQRIGAEGEGFAIAMAALDTGRLGIAACAVGLAQAAMEVAVDYAREREAFGQPIGDFQGVGFLLADMATGIAAARALYLSAARAKQSGRPFGTEAAMAKLFATDMCMKVTTDAVQVLGGAGYVEDYPVERYMREAKVLQIVEGTNQIQRLVISRAISRS
jgi:alkylation response protein AidB-like acyl-CoA dehydrogenase